MPIDSAYRSLLDRMFDGVYFVNRRRQIEYWNPGAERITGFTAEEVVGHRCAENILRHVDEEGHHLCVIGCPLLATMKDGDDREAQVYLHHKLGHRVPVTVRAAPVTADDGRIEGSLEIFSRTASNPFAAMGDDDGHDDLQDSVTALGTRRFGEMNLASVHQAVLDGHAEAGMLFLDIDHFKAVNDTYGHVAGDQVLRMVAQTIANGLGATDIPARWGGEEFLVLMPGVDADRLSAAAERIRILVENSWLDTPTDRIRATISIGASMARPDDTAISWLERTDGHLYTSKHSGRNRVTTDAGPLQPTTDPNDPDIFHRE